MTVTVADVCAFLQARADAYRAAEYPPTTAHPVTFTMEPDPGTNRMRYGPGNRWGEGMWIDDESRLQPRYAIAPIIDGLIAEIRRLSA